MHGILIIIFYSAEAEGVQHEQSNKNQPFVCAGRAGAHCACHVAPICQPAYFTRSDSQSSAKRDLCVFVQRVVLYPLAPHRAGAGAALSAGDIGADGTVDPAALDQVFNWQYGRGAPAVVFLLFSNAVYSNAVGLCFPVVGEGRGFSPAAMDKAFVYPYTASASARSDQ